MNRKRCEDREFPLEKSARRGRLTATLVGQATLVGVLFVLALNAATLSSSPPQPASHFPLKRLNPQELAHALQASFGASAAVQEEKTVMLQVRAVLRACYDYICVLPTTCSCHILFATYHLP